MIINNKKMGTILNTFGWYVNNAPSIAGDRVGLGEDTRGVVWRVNSDSIDASSGASNVRSIVVWGWGRRPTHEMRYALARSIV